MTESDVKLVVMQAYAVGAAIGLVIGLYWCMRDWSWSRRERAEMLKPVSKLPGRIVSK